MYLNNTYTYYINVNTTLSQNSPFMERVSNNFSLYSLDLYLTIAVKVKDETSAESRMYLCK